MYTEFRSELHLAGAPAPVQIKQLVAPQQAGLFWPRGREMDAAQRPDQVIAKTALSGDEFEGLPSLAHWTLIKHLAGENKCCPPLLHSHPSVAQHKNLAVYTGIEVCAESMDWSSENLQEFCAQV
jgi:hypothetical protein